MGATGSIAALSQFTQGAAAAGGSLIESRALRSQGRFRERAIEHQISIREFQARDAVRRGRAKETQLRQSIRREIGSQRVAFAGQGVRVGVGSPQEVQRQTAEVGELEALTIRNNTAREVLGFDLDVSGLELRRAVEGVSARQRERATLLTGGLQLTRGLFGAAGALSTDDVVTEFERQQRRRSAGERIVGRGAAATGGRGLRRAITRG